MLVISSQTIEDEELTFDQTYTKELSPSASAIRVLGQFHAREVTEEVILGDPLRSDVNLTEKEISGIEEVRGIF